jgi:hypothetical protein
LGLGGLLLIYAVIVTYFMNRAAASLGKFVTINLFGFARTARCSSCGFAIGSASAGSIPPPNGRSSPQPGRCDHLRHLVCQYIR